MIGISFSEPLFGLALLLVPLIWFVPSQPRTIAHGVIRTLLFVLVILALMQPVRLAEHESRHFAIVVDQSRSLSDEDQLEAQSISSGLLEKFQEEGSVTVVQVGGAELFSMPDGMPRVQRIHLKVDDESPLGDALALAAQAIPVGMSGSITLVSDGFSTDRYWNAAVGQIKARGIPVHTLELATSMDDVYLADLRTESLRSGEALKVSVDLLGQGDDMRVLLYANGDAVGELTSIDNTGRSTLNFEIDAPEAGFMALTAELFADSLHDVDPTNNSISGTVAIQDPVRILYFSTRQEDGQERLGELLGSGFELDAGFDLTSEEIGPTLSDYDLVVLDDVSARALPLDVHQQLIDAVREDGLGLFMSGGEASFGDGGFHTSPIEEVLPVKMPGDEDKIDPSVALAIILDTSGSMAGTRIELAKHIARIAVRRMQPHDRIGIVEFYGNKHWAIPMQPASNKIEIDRAIGRMKAIGGTVLFPAIQEAYYGLKNVNTRFKHILLITDAGVEDSDYEGMLRRISKDRINVSTILVGQGGHNQIMSDMANWGQGRFYSVGNQFQLVELILKQPSTKKPSMYKRGSFTTVPLGGEGWWGPVEQSSIPPLQGYVETEVKDGAEVLLEERATRHPLLTTWRYGLGRVTTFVTEPTGNGTQEWQSWRDYAEFLGRVLGRTAADNQGFDFDLTRLRSTAFLTAKATTRHPGWLPTARVVNAERDNISVQNIDLQQRAPGFFQAALPVGATVPLEIVGEIVGSSRNVRIASHPDGQFKGETQVDPKNAMDLSMLAEFTGGSSLATDTLDGLEAQVSAGELSFVVEQLWPWLLLLALLVFLTDLVYRRWPRQVG